MLIEIEGKRQKTTIKHNIISKQYDIQNNQYVCTTIKQTTETNSVYSYKDFDLMFCFVQKEELYLRFVLFNVKQQKSIVLLTTKVCDIAKLFRLNKNCFAVLCTNKNTTVMHCVKIENNQAINNEININIMHQVGFVKDKYIIVNSTMHQKGYNLHSIKLFKSGGEFLRIVVQAKSAYDAQFVYEYKSNILRIYDVHSTDIILEENFENEKI